MKTPPFDYQSGVLPAPTTLRDRALLILRHCEQDLFPRLEQLQAKRIALAAEYRKVIETVKIEEHQRRERAWLDKQQIQATIAMLRQRRLEKALGDTSITQNHVRRRSIRIMARDAVTSTASLRRRDSIPATSSSISRKRPQGDSVDTEERAPSKRAKSTRKNVNESS